jgi:UDP-N-acetylglucosamine/UDP-N-acetylgalactosamine diphosphorylase
LQAERLNALKRLAAARSSGGGGGGARLALPWYVMTSEATRRATEAHFEAHSYFGLPREDVLLFNQGSLPCLTPDGGKILMASAGEVASAPDGNGALFEALRRSGSLADMTARGIEVRCGQPAGDARRCSDAPVRLQSVYVYCVDNLIVRLGDPHLVGFCRMNGAAAGAKARAAAAPRRPPPL